MLQLWLPRFLLHGYLSSAWLQPGVEIDLALLSVKKSDKLILSSYERSILILHGITMHDLHAWKWTYSLCYINANTIGRTSTSWKRNPALSRISVAGAIAFGVLVSARASSCLDEMIRKLFDSFHEDLLKPALCTFHLNKNRHKNNNQSGSADAKPKPIATGFLRFSALGTGYVCLLRVLIGSLCCLRLWLTSHIANALVLA